MAERYELRQGGKVLRTLDHDDLDRDVERAVARQRLNDEMRSLDARVDEEDAGVACDC